MHIFHFIFLVIYFYCISQIIVVQWVQNFLNWLFSTSSLGGTGQDNLSRCQLAPGLCVVELKHANPYCHQLSWVSMHAHVCVCVCACVPLGFHQMAASFHKLYQYYKLFTLGCQKQYPISRQKQITPIQLLDLAMCQALRQMFTGVITFNKQNNFVSHAPSREVRELNQVSHSLDVAELRTKLWFVRFQIQHLSSVCGLAQLVGLAATSTLHLLSPPKRYPAHL